MNLAFPLCREPAHEDAMRRVLERCVAFITARLPAQRLVGLVLTGSFSRGEGTVLAVDGRLRVLGDIECLVLMASEGDYWTMRREIAGWGAEASAQLLDLGVHVDIEFGPSEVDYLAKRARPSIFVHDLREHGKVLWGPPDLLDAIPPFGTEAIPREDAVFLLFNRMIEQLEAYDLAPTADHERLLDLAYQRHKLLLDLAGSVLAFTGRHCSSYLRRPAAFARLLAETPSLQAVLPATIVDDLAATARAKMAPLETDMLPATVGGIAEQRAWLRRQIVGAVPLVTRVLRWELEQLLGTRGDLPALLDGLARTARLPRRAWDWAKVAVHPMPAPMPLSPLRAARLFWRSTPRLLIYEAAALAYLDLAGGEVGSPAIPALLPVDPRRLGAEAVAQRRTIIALWRWCIRNN